MKYQIDENYTNLAKNIINDYTNTEVSILRFCINQNITTSAFKSLLTALKYSNEQELYNKTLYKISLIEENKEEKLNNDIYTIFNIIKNNNYINAFEFFKNTKYSVYEILKRCDKILSIEEAKIFRNYVARFRINKLLNTKEINYLLTDGFKTKINNELINISPLDCLNILTSLKLSGMPITKEIFIEAYIYNKNNNIEKQNTLSK